MSQTNFSKNHKSGYSDAKIIEGVLKNSNDSISYIYSEFKSKIKKMVWSYRNTLLDPEDIFQEGITRMVINIRAGKFRGDSSISTYLNSICRNICLKELAKHRFTEFKKDIEIEIEGYNFERLALILNIKKTIDRKCREIIDLRFDLKADNLEKVPKYVLSFGDIAKKLKLTSSNARQRFKRCMDKLRKLVEESPEFKEFYI